MKTLIEKIDVGSLELKDQVVSINRVTKVVKGGKNLSFSALVVVGDGNGHVGYGMGKAREVSSAIKKGVEAAKKNVVKVPITEKGATTPHNVVKATVDALLRLKRPERVARLRGKTVADILGTEEKKAEAAPAATAPAATAPVQA